MSELYIEMLDSGQIPEPEDYDYQFFMWNGESEDMIMEDYMKASGDTLYSISGEQPELLDFN